MKNSDMPAMPQERDLWVEGIGICPTNGTGLTKREYFAGLAMQGLLAGAFANTRHQRDCVNIAVQHADALLAELERTK